MPMHIFLYAKAMWYIPSIVYRWEINNNKLKILLLVSNSQGQKLMTFIWPFRVSEGQTDCAIRFAIYKLL